MKVVDRAGNEHDVTDVSSITQVKYVPCLEFQNFRVLFQVVRGTKKLRRNDELDRQQVWLGSYFRSDVLNAVIPDLSIRWVSDEIGWGVFAEKDLPNMTLVAEYSGMFRKKKKGDAANAYCFECPLVRGEESPFVIDAEAQGGVSRYINHSETPNVVSALATIHDVPHILLFTTEVVKQGTELRYHYGADYWKRRKKSK
jgi:hypothetical protein